MSESTQTTADDLAEQVRDLFSDTREVLPTDGSELADELSDSERSTVRELAGEAADLLETSDPGSLLAALGLGGSDGPGSIPAAILTGDPDDVADLRILLALSRLAPAEDGDSADGAFDEQGRAALATLGDLLGDGAVDESETDTSGDETEAADAPDGSDAPDGETDAAEAEGADETVTSALQDALDEVQTGIGDALGLGGSADEGGQSDKDGGLVEAAGDLVGETSERLGDVAAGENEADGESEAASERDETADSSDEAGDETADSDDGGLLAGGDGGLLAGDEDGGSSIPDRESVSGFGRSTYSTIPAQDRPDMAAVRRHSTMASR